MALSYRVENLGGLFFLGEADGRYWVLNFRRLVKSPSISKGLLKPYQL